MAGAMRRLGSSPRGVGPNSPRRKNRSANCVLVVLLVLAFLFSSATIFIMSPSITRSILALDDSITMGGYEKTIAMEADQVPPAPTTSSDPLPTGTRRTTSDLVTWMLAGRDKDSQTQHNAMSTFHNSPTTSLEFIPGTLSLTHAQTLKHCWAKPAIYGNHFQGGRGDGSRVPVSYSDKHKLAYVMIPKSGSSTARFMLKNEFDARETSKSLQPESFKQGRQMEGTEVISFVRDPLSRFYSQYDEAFVRTPPWQKNANPYYVDPENKQHRAPHPFPYLYENLHSYHDYEDAFCPINTRKSRKDCIFRKSAENGTLTERFERFVREYDGRNPFDIHLTLQVPMMSSNDGMPLHLTQIFNTTDSEGGWQHIAKQFLGENAMLGKEGQKDGGVIAGRSYPRRFNSDLVSIETQRRICELALLDYCCLNLPLPDVCKGQHYEDAATGAKRELFCVVGPAGRIEPGIFPEKSKS